jgi:tetrapyrrole methylase family protein/MazG family protein
MNITIAGMKPDGSISEHVLKAAKEASAVVLQTSLNGAVQPGFTYETLDALYDQAEDFDTLIESACSFMLRDGLMFVALGDLAHNRIAASLAQRARAAGGHVRVISDGSPALGAALAAGMLDGGAGVCVHTASTFTRMDDTSQVLVVNEIDSVFKASDLKLRLMAWYDDEYPVLLVDTRNGKGENILLCQLDGAASYGYYTSVVIVPCAKTRKNRFTFADLLDVMAQLRSRHGCPWDKAQTHESLKRYLIEEGYEVLDAIDTGDMDALADELGDVLLQVVFHARIAEQQGEFDISDVTTAICRKMISRHPHIFGDAAADTPEIVLSNWEQIKKEERGQQTQTDVLQSVPRSMPALMRSGKVQHKAAHVGFDLTEAAQAMDKLREEIAEVESADSPDELAVECGDLLFAAVNVVRLCGVEPETALQKATDKFITRFSLVERLAAERKVDMRTCGLAVLDALWAEVKAAEMDKQS